MRRLVVMAAMLAGPAAADEFLAFRSPSGNIGCMAMTGSWTGVRCDVMELAMSYPQRPADCDLDWGHAFEVAEAGPGTPVCAGDTVMDPGAMVLPYGGSITGGGVTCTSERTGMTCVNSQGHGFSVARAAQRVF
jgi:hypothetical protein